MRKDLVDPELENNQIKGTFDRYVDTLVIKNYITEQLQSRLKISKSLATQFVNKLNGNEVLILSKILNEFIKYLEDTYNNINDYILRSSFNVLQSNYNITQQKEKNQEIIKNKQDERDEAIRGTLPAEQLEQAEEEEGMDETITATPKFTEEGQKFVSFLNKTIFKVKGIRGIITAPTIKKIVFIELLYGKPNSFVDVPGTKIQGKYIDELIPLIEREGSEEKRQMRLILQDRIKGVFLKFASYP